MQKAESIETGCIPLDNCNENGSSKLGSRHVSKPWGRIHLPSEFETISTQPVGEVWFVGNDRSPLLAKYLFTSENLSVQVHPNDEQARSRGYKSGKAECWLVIDAEPGALIGLGLRYDLTPDTLRRAVLNGSVEQLIAWRPVAAGDFFFVPPGTIHAIGAGISILELQQNSDVTYRLYDYGRGRDLHLDEGIAVAQCDRYPERLYQRVNPATSTVLVDGPHFTVVHSRGDALQGRDRLILPIDGYATVGEEIARPGECLLLLEHKRLDSVEGRILVAAASSVEAVLLQTAA